MAWAEVFVVLVVSHVVGDFLLQTEWQATHKQGGLGRDSTARRALVAHVTSYILAFIPALAWLAGDLGFGVLGVAVMIGVPHLVQDDGRIVVWWMAHVKHASVGELPLVAAAVDQTFHVVALLALALATGA